MSYRSDVRIITSKEGFKKLKEYSKRIYDELNPNNDGTYNIIEDVGEIKEGEHFVQLNFECVKWYESYLDVQSVMKALDEINAEGYGYSYGRIGENLEDVTLLYNEGNEDFPDDYYLPHIEVYTNFHDNFLEL